MKTKKGTKRALLGSVIVMLLCLAMLIGSTFAWFTDSAATAVNTIQAGNLDLLVEYADSFDAAGKPTNWAEVSETTELFSATEADGTTPTPNLWEPGHTEVVYLKVSNKGTLALKYRLGANAAAKETQGTNVAGTKFNLSDHLVFGTVIQDTEITKFSDRAAAQAAVNGSSFTLGAYTADTVLYPAGTEGKPSEQYIALVVYMPTYVGNEANYKQDSTIPKITLGVALEATQTPYESDSFGEDYDENAEYPVKVGNANEFKDAINAGKDVILTDDINLTITQTTIKKDTVIDLGGHTLAGAQNKSALDVKDATVTIKNGTIEATPTTSGSALCATRAANVTVENCIIKTNSNRTYAVCTNGSLSTNTTITIRNSTISAPNGSGAKGYAAYIPAGNVTFIDCNTTGHVFISGGNVTINGGTYTATGFNTQDHIWDKEETASYVGKSSSGTAITMGDSILIADRRDGYTLSSLTIRNVTFNTEIPGVGIAYAIKYVDMAKNGAASPVNYVIENNKFNNKIDGKDPTMFIDLTGADISR